MFMCEIEMRLDEVYDDYQFGFFLTMFHVQLLSLESTIINFLYTFGNQAKSIFWIGKYRWKCASKLYIFYIYRQFWELPNDPQGICFSPLDYTWRKCYKKSPAIYSFWISWHFPSVQDKYMDEIEEMMMGKWSEKCQVSVCTFPPFRGRCQGCYAMFGIVIVWEYCKSIALRYKLEAKRIWMDISYKWDKYFYYITEHSIAGKSSWYFYFFYRSYYWSERSVGMSYMLDAFECLLCDVDIDTW